MPRRLIAIAALMLLLQACVGFSTHGTERSSGESLAAGEPGPSLAGWPRPVLSSSLLERWGEPDRTVSMPGGQERWVYAGDLRWSGIVLWVFIPLPLVIPVGHENHVFLIENGTAISVDTVRQAGVYRLCGIIPGMCSRFGCGTVRT